MCSGKCRVLPLSESTPLLFIFYLHDNVLGHTLHLRAIAQARAAGVVVEVEIEGEVEIEVEEEEEIEV